MLTYYLSLSNKLIKTILFITMFSSLSSAETCPSFVITSGIPTPICSQEGLMKATVYVTWDFGTTNLSEIDLYNIDWNIRLVNPNNSANLDFNRTTWSLAANLSSVGWLEFSFNSSNGRVTLKRKANNNDPTKISFPVGVTPIFDLYFYANEKTAVDVEHDLSTSCIWNIPQSHKQICYGNNTDCVSAAVNPSLQFVEPRTDVLSIKGEVSRPDFPINNKLARVSIQLDAGTFHLFQLTGNDGKYCFDIPQDPNTISANQVALTVSRNVAPECGITARDISVIRKMILGIMSPSPKETVMSSDVTNNGVITTRDIVCLQKSILQIPLGEFCGGLNDSWRFITNEEYNNYPEALNVPVLGVPKIQILPYPQASFYNYNFKGAKIGDANLSCEHYLEGNFNGSNASARANGLDYSLLLGSATPDPLNPSRARIPVYAENSNIFALFSINFKLDGKQIYGLEAGSMSINEFFNYKTSPSNGITLAWVSENSLGENVSIATPLFYLVVDNNNQAILPVVLSNAQVENNIMFGSGIENNLLIGLINSSAGNNLKSKGRISPNPAGEYIDIYFNSQETATHVLELSNSVGVKVHSRNWPLQKGDNWLRMDISPYAEGNYIIRLQGVPEFSAHSFTKIK